MNETLIRMTPRVYRDYRRTIARHKPETAAILGGRLDDPMLITEFRFCPPLKKNDHYQSSGAHVDIDAELMNWTVLNEWEPNGLYILGFWHSHPRGVSSPSGRGGDLEFFKNCLENEAAIAAGWDRVLAPITTFDKAGKDMVHGWSYGRGEKRPESANVVVEHNGEVYEPEEFETLVQSAPASRNDSPQAPSITQGAESLVLSLAQTRARLRHTEGLNIWDRLILLRQNARLQRAMMSAFIRDHNLPPAFEIKLQRR